MTYDAGILFLSQADKRIGLIDTMANALEDRRQINKIRFDVKTMLRERIFAIALGYEDCNDLDT